jgi:hypothetical protein
MSADGDGDGDGDSGPGRREVAHRLFAAEFDDVTVSYRESDEERAPNYVVTPTGARLNRLFAVGVLTEVEPVNDGVVRARIADPTGAFVSYAGQYQPDALAVLERTEPPAFVALTGKGRTFEPDDGDRVYSSVRPESVTTVEADDRDRWVVTAAEATLERVALLAAALDRPERGDDLRAALRDAGVRESLAAGVPLAIERYDTGRPYLEAVRRTAVAALELVAGDREQVEPLSVEPGATGDATLGPLPPTPLDDAATPGPATEPPGASGEATEPESASASESEAEAEPEPDRTTHPDSEPEPDRTAEPEPTTSTAEGAGAETGPTGDELGGFDDGGELGDFDAGGDDGSDSLGAAEFDDDEMYELDEDERREVEAEFGTEFSTGGEVDEPGTADIDVPETVPGEGDDGSETDAAGDAGVGSEPEPEPASGSGSASASASAPASGTDAPEDEPVDLEDAAVEAMADLDDGDGAERERVVAALVDRHGADPDAAADAIQDALMGGRCYEPDEDRLKAR